MRISWRSCEEEKYVLFIFSDAVIFTVEAALKVQRRHPNDRLRVNYYLNNNNKNNDVNLFNLIK